MAGSSKTSKSEIGNFAFERVETGIPGFDKLIEGGLIRGSTYLVAGQTGTGKSIFSVQYILNGLRKGEPGVYITLEQSTEEIIEDMSKFGWGEELKKYMDSGKLAIVSSVPTSIKDLQETALTNIRRVGAKRFVLDSLSVATMSWKVSSMDIGKVRSEIFDFMRTLEHTGLTSLLITEIPEGDVKKISRFGFEEFIADGVIILHYLEYAAGGTPRSLIIRKMRRTNHGTDIYPIEITKDGLVVKKAI